MYELVPFRDHHIFQVAPFLREEDCLEATALGKDVDATLEASIKSSTNTFTILLEGSPVGFFGYTGRDDEDALIWMVGTNRLTEHPLSFCKTARGVIVDLLRFHPRLFNSVHRGNTVHIDWLKAMGAEFYTTLHPDYVHFQITR